MLGATDSSALAGCYVISLRPVGAHAGLRRAAARHGARVLALAPWKLVRLDDAGSVRDLRAALSAPRVVFTSPAAVRAAAALRPLRPRAGQVWLGVGAGTLAALRRCGVASAAAPERMDSEGLLAMPQLRGVRGLTVGLVTAPGGRGRIAAVLRRRGAQLLRADVYRRLPVAPAPHALARLRALRAPLLLAVSSGEALERTLAALPPDLAARLRQARVLAASARLADLARARGFARVAVAADARPGSLLAAAGAPIR
ncbi:uroporphyrinogen-III synthase [Luteimonas sp. RD2P54]|uniref:Uroporphyrinogen-III synthase n=1 Tax=Luteimonas endophytica TaxID=3042023 RepID=A0ABT6J907_9GAMM|nr:uroporphyrinogen-III synthase [Luteimonas endophytica]MDH5823307.1 uroporphyrinogen-III synthase [Luteimonas endophytica]